MSARPSALGTRDHGDGPHTWGTREFQASGQLSCCAFVCNARESLYERYYYLSVPSNHFEKSILIKGQTKRHKEQIHPLIRGWPQRKQDQAGNNATSYAVGKVSCHGSEICARQYLCLTHFWDNLQVMRTTQRSANCGQLCQVRPVTGRQKCTCADMPAASTERCCKHRVFTERVCFFWE